MDQCQFQRRVIIFLFDFPVFLSDAGWMKGVGCWWVGIGNTGRLRSSAHTTSPFGRMFTEYMTPIVLLRWAIIDRAVTTINGCNMRRLMRDKGCELKCFQLLLGSNLNPWIDGVAVVFYCERRDYRVLPNITSPIVRLTITEYTARFWFFL